MQDITGIDPQALPESWTKATPYVDSEAFSVTEFVKRSLARMEKAPNMEKAIRLFDAVRDDIRYDPYQINFHAERYRASYVADLPEAFCVPKAILLTACLRVVGIPAGVGFADVQNHLNSPKLAEMMETDLFSYHGYVALKLDGKVFKVTPTFNRELCERFGVRAIEFDGTGDALFHEFDAEKRQHMEYVKDRGIFEDPPMAKILKDLEEIYPKLKARETKAADLIEDPNFAA